MASANKHEINGQKYYSVRGADGSTTLIIARESGDAFDRALRAQNTDARAIPGKVNDYHSFDALQKATGATNIYPDSASAYLGGAQSYQTVKLPAGVDHAEYMRATYANVTPSGRISQPSLLQQVAPQAAPSPVVKSAATAAGDIETRLGSPAHSVVAEAMHPTLAVGQTRYSGPVSITQTEPGRFSYQHAELPGTRIDVSVTPGANSGDVRVSMSTTVGRHTRQALDGITGRDYDAMLTSLKRDAAGSIAGLGVNTQPAISTGNFNQTLSGEQLEPAARRVEEHRTAQRRGGDIAQAAINDSLRQAGASPQAAEMVRGVTGVNAPEAPRASIDADGTARVTGNMPDRPAARHAATAPINPESGLGRAMAAAEPTRAPAVPTPDEAKLLSQPARGSTNLPDRAPQTGDAFRDAAARMLAGHEAQMPRPAEPTVRPLNPVEARFDQAADAVRAAAQQAPQASATTAREPTVFQPRPQTAAPSALAPDTQPPSARPTAPDGTVILSKEEIARLRAETNARYQEQQAAKAQGGATRAAPQPTVLGQQGRLGNGVHGLAAREAPPAPPVDRAPPALSVPETPSPVSPSTAQATPDRPVAPGEQGPFVRQNNSPTEQPRRVIGGDGITGTRVELPAGYRPSPVNSAPATPAPSANTSPPRLVDPDFILQPQGAERPITGNAATPHAPAGAAAAAHAAEEAAHAPGIGQLARRFGGRLLAKVPLIGAGAAGAMAATNIAQASEEYRQGKITGDQLAAVVAGGTATTGAALTGFIAGTGVEEATVAAQKAVGVPEHLRESTLRETATALGSAIINRFSRPSTPVAGDTMAGFTPPTADTPATQQSAAAPSAPAAATPNAPQNPNMQQALAQAQQSGAVQGAQATNMQSAQQDPSKAPPPVPDQVAAGHSFGLSA